MESDQAARAMFDVLAALIEMLAARGIITRTEVLVLAMIAERHERR